MHNEELFVQTQETSLEVMSMIITMFSLYGDEWIEVFSHHHDLCLSEMC